MEDCEQTISSAGLCL